MTSRDLHDRAIGTAKAEGDLDWLWHLLRSIPTAEDEVGDLEDSAMDMPSTVSAINGYTRADRDPPRHPSIAVRRLPPGATVGTATHVGLPTGVKG